MRPFLILLTLLIFAADLLVFCKLRHALAKLERHMNESLPPQEERHLQNLLKLTGILSAAVSLLVLILILL